MTDSSDTNAEIIVDLAPNPIVDSLRALGAKSVIEFPDLLSHGPVAVDPKRHRKERLGYWRGIYDSLGAAIPVDSDDREVGDLDALEAGYLSAEQLGSAAARAVGDGTIVIWTTPTLEDRLFLWFACHALRAEGIGIEQIAIAEPQLLLPSDNPDEARYANLGMIEDEDISAEFDEIFYPELVYVDAAANLWETFASGSPRQFAVSIGHTVKFFPQLVVFAEDYGRLFPRCNPSRISANPGLKPLELSELDQDLLVRLSSDHFLSVADILDDDLREKYRFLGEISLRGRLRQWSLHEQKGEPYVLAELMDEAGDAGQGRLGYKLSQRGAELVRAGFEAGRKLPIFKVGNARLYAGKKPWVRVVEGNAWGFERFDASL